MASDDRAPVLDRDLNHYDYALPEDRIAQMPVEPRDRARLLVVDSPESTAHGWFRDLPQWLKPGDLLVLNDTAVIPARLCGHKSTGTRVEALLLEERGPDLWFALVRPGRRLKPGAEVAFDPSPAFAGGDPGPLRATVTDSDPETGGRLLKFHLPPGEALLPLLDRWGRVPLPPYITESTAGLDRYQTVYADRAGSAAAPTAGLHFTPDLFERLAAAGIERAFLTLHVGVGTFRPVESGDITQHRMHAEWLEVSPEVVAAIQRTRDRGGRVIAVGTTVVRALESAARDGDLKPYCGKTDLFIYPGYRWRVVEGLITNFHLPRSTLLMLVSALVGRLRLLDLYREALAAPPAEFGRPYRFYSFGDAMLLLPEARATLDPDAIAP